MAYYDKYDVVRLVIQIEDDRAGIKAQIDALNGLSGDVTRHCDVPYVISAGIESYSRDGAKTSISKWLEDKGSLTALIDTITNDITEQPFCWDAAELAETLRLSAQRIRELETERDEWHSTYLFTANLLEERGNDVDRLEAENARLRQQRDEFWTSEGYEKMVQDSIEGVEGYDGTTAPNAPAVKPDRRTLKTISQNLGLVEPDAVKPLDNAPVYRVAYVGPNREYCVVRCRDLLSELSDGTWHPTHYKGYKTFEAAQVRVDTLHEAISAVKPLDKARYVVTVNATTDGDPYYEIQDTHTAWVVNNYWLDEAKAQAEAARLNAGEQE